LETSIKDHLAPLLRNDGFSGSGRTFRRVSGDFIHVVQVQGSHYGGRFAVNLAIHPIAIPDVMGNPPDPKRITDPMCEFRRRLSVSGGDQWWEHEATKDSMDAAVREAAAVYAQRGRELFAEQSGPQAPLSRVTPAEFENGRFDFSGFANTAVGMARALALMRRSAGNLDDARGFAHIGLKHVGSAVALRRELEDLCAAIDKEQP
jgi:hypothetical protein